MRVKGQILAELLQETLVESPNCDCQSRSLCEQLTADLREESALDARARSFDIRRLCYTCRGQMPDASWPTSALVTAARDGILTPPWLEGALQRSVTVTQALGLLGERGLLADAYVRLYLSRTLARRIVIQASHAYVDAREHRRDADSYPHQMSDWFGHLDELKNSQRSLEMLTAEALSGDPIQVAQEWIQQAAMAHVIDWRITDYLAVQIDPRDRVLRGGQEATAWVFDRFSFTSSSEWRRGSAEWEVAYARDPNAVAEFVGVARSILDERPTSLEMALSAQVRGLLSHGERDEAARGLHLSEMVEQILAAIRAGHLDLAEDDARTAHALAPREFVTANALAFCLIPRRPIEAIEILSDLRPRSELEAQLRLANTVCSQVSAGAWSSASETLTAMTPVDYEAHLWSVQSMLDGRPSVEFVSIGGWIDEVATLISSRTEDGAAS